MNAAQTAPRRTLEAQPDVAGDPPSERRVSPSGPWPDPATRRRRRRRLRQLRRDFAADVLVALALTFFVIAVTAGLGVVALLELIGATVVVASFLIERRRRSARRSRKRE